MKIIGLDLSLTRTGIALPDGQLRSLTPKAGASERARRLHEIVSRLDCWIAVTHPELAVIEDYFVGRNVQTALRLGELGGVIRTRLFEHGIRYIDLNTKTLKQYATGNGEASKDDMLGAALGDGVDPANHDEADAHWLRRVGVHAFDSVEPKYLRVELHDVRLRLLADLRWPGANRKRTA